MFTGHFVLVGAAALAGGAVCGQAGDDGPVSLGESLDPLIEHFNQGAGTWRFVALVSPTCPACVFGAKAVRQSVLRAYPDADLEISIIWIDMLPADNRRAAAESSAIFDDPRVKQFHDPGRLAGHAIAAGLLNDGAGPAWDVYLYYDADGRWLEKPPDPVDWYHQLRGTRRADPLRFRPGQGLADALRAATGRLMNAEPRPDVPETLEPSRTAVSFRGAVLQIGGMGCGGCADTVRDALASVPGVRDVDVSFDTRLAWISFADGASAETGTLIQAVQRRGYEAAVPDPPTVLTAPLRFLLPGDQVIEMLTVPECPNTDDLSARLRVACDRLGVACRLEIIDLAALSEDDPRRGWGSPTALVNGADIMGEAKPKGSGLSCRIYPGGKLPSADDLASRLQAALAPRTDCTR